MLNRKGSTLIESLFAFEIFTCVLILFTTLMTTVFQQELKIEKHYQNIIQGEGEVTFQDTFIETIEMVLR